MSSHSKSSAVKVGVLTLVSLTLLVLVLIWLRGRGIGGTAYDVLFRDVDGLREGAPVQMMGIRIGFVDRVEPVMADGKYYVNVKFSINKRSDIELPRGSRLSVEQSGIIGEKFLEITPPVLRSVSITTFKEPAKSVEKGIPVKFLYEEGPLVVGEVEKVEKFADANLVRHRLYYKVTKPGAVMPEDPLFELILGDDGNYFLRIIPREPLLTKQPDKNLRFTIENPLRIKRFLEIQMESAEALKITNDKINQLLSDDTIDTLNSTLKNTEVMTAKATEVLDSANALFKTSGRDLEVLVEASRELSESVSQVTVNLNEVIGDPKLKQDIISTVSSIEQSSKALNEILQDDAIKETLTLARDTSADAAELVAMLKKTANDEDIHRRLDTSLTLLNQSLGKLSNVLSNVEELTDDDEQTLKGILQDTRATAENMRKVTDKFDKRFTLFRLLF